VSRVLGVDYGTKRVGLAISDGIGLTARPLTVVSPGQLMDTLETLSQQYDIDEIVIGLPTGLRGHEGESANRARLLGAQIGETMEVDVIYVDERFTSRMAESTLLEAGMRRRDRKETVDKVAAAIILQTYLDGRGSPGNSPGDSGVETPGNS
jgi:putative Holliday junction resolvase